MTCRVEITWTCGRCASIMREEMVSSAYEDPLLVPPEGWDYGKDQNTFLCADCLLKEANP